MIKGLADTVGVRDGEENVVAAIVVDSGREVESRSPMFCPCPDARFNGASWATTS
jgi:hypothetical protein